MKIEIYFLNTKLITEIKKDIQVKDLLYDLKQYFNDITSNFILFDNNSIQLKESDTISAKKGIQLKFYLIKTCSYKKNIILSDKKEKSNDTINNLIMKCTGANKPLDTKAQVPIYPNRFRFLDFVDNGNNNNPQENNPLDRLLNLLHAIEENNQIEIIGRPNNNNNNNIQIEADERALRELQNMGFPEDRARQALISSRNDINRATEILLGDSGE